MVILNSIEAITDLLESRSATYSSRPRLVMAQELMECNWLFSLLPYGSAWRERRRVFGRYFHPTRVDIYQPTQRKFVRAVLNEFLNTPDDFATVLRHGVAGSAISLAYGLKAQKRDDPYVLLGQQTVRKTGNAASPNTFLVNSIPALKYLPECFPGSGFKQKVREFRAVAEKFRTDPFRAALSAMDAGTANPSLTTSAVGDLAGYDQKQLSRKQNILMDVAATTFAAASDTTLTAVMIFFAAILVAPEKQKKAQEELDRVLQGRLPDFNDRPALPYINAMVKEVIRWGVITPVCVPHTTVQDDIYKGYFIPKGASVIANSWALLHDEQRYGLDPSAFRPERFLKDGELDPNVYDPVNVVFGYGRRACPGSHVALDMLYLIIASTLSVFNIDNPLDKNGAPVEPKIEWICGPMREPVPFECTIRPRSKEAEKLIREVDLHN